MSVRRALWKKKKKLVGLHEKKVPPRPGDWLWRYWEPGQSFRQYLRIRPVTVDARRRFIYILPIGKFSKSQSEILKTVKEYMGLFFNLPVRIKQPLADKDIPIRGRRGDQFLTGYILKELLEPGLPADAAVLIAFTTRDLTPGRGWNYVFGKATLKKRVAVWSMFRFGNPARGPAAYQKCLKRTMKLATHETGHMFSIRHCKAYECLMNGCNDIHEADRAPLYLCPECVCKICYATNTDLNTHFRNQILFASKYRFRYLLAFYRKSLERLVPDNRKK